MTSCSFRLVAVLLILSCGVPETSAQLLGRKRRNAEANNTQPAQIQPVQPVAQQPAAPAARGAQASRQLATQMNSLCWSLHNNYKGKGDFQEAYQEAYELLQLSHQIDRTLQAGKGGAEVAELLKEFDGEIHHVEHHVVDFAGKDKEQSEAGRLLEQVEATLVNMLKENGVSRQSAGALAHDDHDHEGAAAKPTELSKALDFQMNAFCWSLMKKHKGKPDFTEAYQESYELLQSAKKIDELVRADKSGPELAEMLTEFDSEIHHVEHHVAVFAAGGKVNLDSAEDESVQLMEDVEATLHKLMSAKGVKREHAEGHKHPKAEGDAAKVGKEELAVMSKGLAEKMTLFCNAMRHNYKKNPDFKEAYGEAYELYELAKKIEQGLKQGDVADDTKELLNDFDSEIHHVENHVKSFTADDDGAKDGPRRLGRKLTEVEKSLHALMSAAGVERKHVEKESE